MRHLKSFNESNLPVGVRFRTLMRNVKSGTTHYTDNDAQMQAWKYVENIEKATGEEVVEIEGMANESEVDLDITLSDDSNILISYGEMNSWESGYQQFGSPGTNDKFQVIYNGESRNNRQPQFKKLEKELNEEYWENEVYYLLKDMVPEPEPEPTHFIKFPKESWKNNDFDNSTDFVYEQDKHGNEEVYFYSEEAAKKWLESLEIKILNKGDY